MTGLMIAALASWINVAAYTFDDMVRDIVPGGKGGAAIKEIAALLEKTSVQSKTTGETEEFRKYMIASLGRFDFMKLYRSRYFADVGDGFRGVAFQGCNRGSHYSMNLVTSKKGKCEVSRIWDYNTLYALKKNDRCIAGGRSFIVSVRSLTATGNYSHRNGMAFIGGLLRIIDPVNIRQLRAPECGLFSSLEGESRAVVNEFHRSFPGVSEFFDRYAIIRSLVKVKDHKGVPYTHCEIRYGYRIKGLEKDYPRLAKSLREIRDLYLIRMNFRNAGGNTILSLLFDSRDDVLACSFYTRGGRFVPFDASGNPVFNEEIAPGSVKDLSYYAVMDMVHNVHGLKFTTNNVIVRFQYLDTPAKGSVRVRLGEVPRTAISGKLYNVLSTWLIDLFVPNNMEQLIFDFSRVMANAHEGRGTMVTLEWDTRDAGKVMLDFNFLSEFIDNYFIRYGLKVWSKKMMADEPFTVEAKKITAKLLEAFRADIDKLKL